MSLADQAGMGTLVLPPVSELFGSAVQLGDIGARALHPHDHAFSCEFTQRAVDRHAADAELLHQRRFAGHRVARPPSPALDVLLDEVFDLAVGGFHGR
mgnify:CR=1 FL=1